MLLKLSYALEESIEYFLLDTPYACAETIINIHSFLLKAVVNVQILVLS